jgi:hypothetical protein
MNDLTRNGDDGRQLVEEFKDALYDDVEQGPARIEFERRRLVARVASNLDAEQSRVRSRGLWIGLAAAGAAAAAVLIVLSLGSDDPPGGAESISLSGLWRVRAGDALARGAPVHVPADAGAKVVLDDGTSLWLGGGAELRVGDDDIATVRLLSGRLLASVAPRRELAPFRVITALAEITVHGTVFSISADAGRSRLRLHEGGVSLSFGEETIDVQPGHEVAVDEKGAIALRPIDSAGALADLLIAEKTADLAGPAVPELAAPRAEAGAEVEPLVEPPTTAPTEPPAEPDAPLPRVSSATPRKPATPPPAAADPEPDPPTAALEDPELAAIEVEPAPALDVLTTLRALMDRGAFADAIETADAYLTEHPGGEHADDVLYLRAHCQARAGDLTGGRQSLKDYLTRFPEGRYWDRVRDILGE